VGRDGWVCAWTAPDPSAGGAGETSPFGCSVAPACGDDFPVVVVLFKVCPCWCLHRNLLLVWLQPCVPPGPTLLWRVRVSRGDREEGLCAAVAANAPTSTLLAVGTSAARVVLLSTSDGATVRSCGPQHIAQKCRCPSRSPAAHPLPCILYAGVFAVPCFPRKGARVFPCLRPEPLCCMVLSWWQVGEFTLPALPPVAVRSLAVFPDGPFRFLAVGTDNGVHLLVASQTGPTPPIPESGTALIPRAGCPPAFLIPAPQTWYVPSMSVLHPPVC
jgi:hypothetical protein